MTHLPKIEIITPLQAEPHMSGARWMRPAFQTLRDDALQHAPAWRQIISQLSAVRALDIKTQSLRYPSVRAALRLNGGIPFNGVRAPKAGVRKAEIVRAVLTGLTAAKHCVTPPLTTALETIHARPCLSRPPDFASSAGICFHASKPESLPRRT